MASLYTRVKKRNPEIKWEYVNTGINVDIEAWIKAKKSIPAWSKYIREEGKEVNEKLDKVAQTIDLLFKEGKIKSNDDKPILENALSLIANNDALKVREEVAARQKRQRELDKKEQIRKRKLILNFYQYFLDGITDKSTKMPAIKKIERVSTPGLRRYTDVKDMPRVLNGLGIAIISTSKGIITDKEAKEQNVGGEVYG